MKTTETATFIGFLRALAHAGVFTTPHQQRVLKRLLDSIHQAEEVA